jgi:hypothetical protein
MTTHEIRQDDKVRSTQTWQVARIPIPIKTVVTNENMTSTTELMSMTLAR